MKFDDFMKEIGEDTIEAETIRQIAHMVSDIGSLEWKLKHIAEEV